MKVLGISCYYHDAAAALIIDNKAVAAAAEERFSRKKHDNNFPHLAIEFCLNQAGLAINEIDAIAFYEKPLIKFDRILHQHLAHFPKSYKSFVESMGSWVNQKLNIKETVKKDCHYFGPVYFVPHHLSHAASSYYLSDFKEATTVTIDGVGEWATTTVGAAKGNKISIEKEMHFPHSLGLLYSTMTAFLGFKVNNDEYKVMGLSAYGNPKPYMRHFRHLIKSNPDGSYQLNMRYFDFDWAKHMPSTAIRELFGMPIRTKNDPITQKHANIAAALQKTLEETVFNLLTKAHQQFPSDNLCLAGGVALNSLMNGKILSNTPFKNLYIPPDPGDGGGALGAALEVSLRLRRNTAKKTTFDFSPYLGPSFEWYQIEPILTKYNLSYSQLDRDQLVQKTASLLTQNHVVGWFQGKMEWGPRALGNRSFLASARTAEMKDIINAQVKKREMFRPFAPVILEEKTDEYFKCDAPLPNSAKYMVVVYPFQEDKKADVPAVVHQDGTGRLQTIAREDNPLYYDVIKAYAQKTGIPIIINTSLNVQEPIVCTPEDAVKCFLNTDVNYMVIGDYLITKE
jgi:carbamoyltransferase